MFKGLITVPFGEVVNVFTKAVIEKSTFLFPPFWPYSVPAKELLPIPPSRVFHTYLRKANMDEGLMAMWLWQEQTWICNLPLTLNSCTTLHKIGDCAPESLPGAARGSALWAMPRPVLLEGTGPRKHVHVPCHPGHS